MRRREESLSLGSLGPTARAVIRELLLAGPLPRAELARRLALSPASLTKTTRPLLDSGIITADEALSVDSPGRPGTPLALDAGRHQFIGFKVTSDALFATRTDALGQVLETVQRSLDATDVSTVVDGFIHIINEMAAQHPIQAVGIGAAGMMRRFDHTVRHNLYLTWDDVPLADILQQATGIPAVVSNDARALTVGVQWSGPGRGRPDLAVVTVGVGIGLGVVLEGRVVAGTAGNAGLIGHTRVSETGGVCDAGHRGCASAMLNAEAITRAIGIPRGLVDLSLPEACRLAADGDQLARRVLSDAGRALGAIIADVVNLLGVPLVVLAGDGLEMITHARAAMEETLADRLDPWATPPEIEVFSSDFDEWARGAAVVACQWLLVEPPDTARPDHRPPVMPPMTADSPGTIPDSPGSIPDSPGTIPDERTP